MVDDVTKAISDISEAEKTKKSEGLKRARIKSQESLENKRKKQVVSYK